MKAGLAVALSVGVHVALVLGTPCGGGTRVRAARVPADVVAVVELVVEAETVAELGSETVAEPETETDPESEAVAESETVAESEAVAESESESEPEPESEAVAESETGSELESGAGSLAGVERAGGGAERGRAAAPALDDDPQREGGGGPRSEAARRDELRAYLRAVQRAIATQAQAQYARAGGMRGDHQELSLSLRITLDENGQIASVVLARSSGSVRLDRVVANATDAVRLPIPPDGVARVQRVLTLPIRFATR